jgi:hypothetical protein
MVRVLAFLSVCFLAVAGVGCGGGGTHPVSDCDNFIANHYCPDVYSCGANYTSVSECISYVEAALGCGDVIGENPGLGTCENDLDNASINDCGYIVDSAGYGAIPASCQNVFIK